MLFIIKPRYQLVFGLSKIESQISYSTIKNLPTEVSLSGRGSGRLSKWSQFQALVDAANFLGRGPALAPDSISKDYSCDKNLGTPWGKKEKKNHQMIY